MRLVVVVVVVVAVVLTARAVHAQPAVAAAPAAAPAAPAAAPAADPAPPAAAYAELYQPAPVDPRRGVIQMGASVTGSDSWIHGAYVLEGGVTIPKLLPSPYYVRALATLQIAGGTIQSDWSGEYARFGGGGELGGCMRFVCGFVDLDVAYQHATLRDNSDRLQGDRTGPHFYGRAGLDLGSGRFHVRGAIEIGRWKTHHSPSEWLATGGIFLGVGLRI